MFSVSRHILSRQVTGSRQFSNFQAISDSFISIHDSTGLPWLVIVPLCTISLRTIITLPLSIWQRKRIVKQQELRKIIQSVSPVTKLRLAAANQSITESLNPNGSTLHSNEGIQKSLQRPKLTPEQITLLSVKETRKRQKLLFQKYNVPMWKNIILPIVQVPLWVVLSMGLRKLTETKLVDTNIIHSNLPSDSIYQSFLATVGSMDLGLPLDSMPMLIPIILGIFSMINIEHNGTMMKSNVISASGIETASNSMSRGSRSISSIVNISRLSCVFMIGVSSQAPILLSLYWTSSQLYSLIQNRILDWLWPYQK